MLHGQPNIQKHILVSRDLSRAVGVEWCDHKFCGKESNLILKKTTCERKNFKLLGQIEGNKEM